METRNRRIMVVDDTDIVRNMLLSILHKSHYETKGFTSPLEALKEIQHNSASISHYALVVTDNRMPDVNDGLELARRIYQINPAIPIIMITGTPYDLDEQVRPLNIKEVFVKPYGTHQFLKSVEEHRLKGN
jgi:CheY-like chemotaxis protein